MLCEPLDAAWYFVPEFRYKGVPQGMLHFNQQEIATT